jgi:hypothetical protein
MNNNLSCLRGCAVGAESSKIRLSDQIIAPKLVKSNLCCLLEIKFF